MPKFTSLSAVRHLKTGNIYVITGTPETHRLEAGNEPAYAYRQTGPHGLHGPIWVRCQAEMEDGRFEPCSAPTHTIPKKGRKKR